MWADNETTEDLLGFTVDVNILKKLILNDDLDPLTIGIFGDWGSGKSSLLQMLHDDFEGNTETIVIKINTWVLENYDNAKSIFIKTFLKNIEENTDPSFKTKISTLLKKVNWFEVAKDVGTKLIIPAISAYATGGISLLSVSAANLIDIDKKMADGEFKPEGLKKYLRENVDNISERTYDSLVNFRADIENLILEIKKKRLIVIVDNLDRCSPERVYEILEAIKLFLNVKGTCFLVGVDQRMIKKAIKFSLKLQSEDNPLVKDYIEKIIQVPYQITPLSKQEVESYIALLLLKIKGNKEDYIDCRKKYIEKKKEKAGDSISIILMDDIKSKFKDLEISLEKIEMIAELITTTLKGNPRQIKRFLNILMLRNIQALEQKLDNFKLDILAKLMVLEYTNFEIYQKLYFLSISVDEGKNDLKKLESGEEIDKESLWNSEFIKKWIELKPAISELNLKPYFWLCRERIKDYTHEILDEKIKKIIRKIEGVELRKINVEYEKLKKQPDFEEGKIFSACLDIFKTHPDQKNLFIFLCLIAQPDAGRRKYLKSEVENFAAEYNHIKIGIKTYLEK